MQEFVETVDGFCVIVFIYYRELGETKIVQRHDFVTKIWITS